MHPADPEPTRAPRPSLAAATPLLEKLEHGGARLLARLPRRVQVALAGGAPLRVDGLALHPDVQLVLALRRALRMPDLSSLPPPEARARVRRDARVHAGVLEPVRSARELVLGGPAGPLRARHYAPDEAFGPAPVLVFFHGGGFVVGDLDTHDAACRILCRHAGAHVLAVDYRLAPEHPFPAAIEDARAAYAFARANAASFGGDPSRVAVGGDSAGGNLAAVVSRLAAREGEIPPAAQLLLYPSVDRSRAHPSVERFAEGFFLTRADIEWHIAQYVGHREALFSDPRVSPLLASDLSGLPPALVVTAAFDPLRDEGEAYAEALRKAGNQVVLRRMDGLVHGFANMVGVSPSSRAALVEVAGALRALLALDAPGRARSARDGA